MLLDNSYKLLNVEPLWRDGLDGSGVVVAVVDTGINSKIPAMQRNGKTIVIDSLQLYGEYVMWHGTAVASCIASQDAERKGVAPGVNLLNVEVFQPNGGASYWDILKGWDWVAEWKAKHPNMYVICCNSLGSHPLACKSGGWASPSILDEAANEMVIFHDIPMIVAAGNKASFGPFSTLKYALMINSPGQAQHVLTVGAVDDNLQLAPFSCRGGTMDGKPKPDVVAPGARINMFDDRGQKITKDGTSFATPLVAGCAALIAQEHQEYSAKQIQDCFKSSAMDLGVHGYNKEYGHGMVDAEVALAVINGQQPEETYTPIFGIIIVIGVIALFIPELKKAKK
jgi:subtilisin family serine protease